jgi:hypothetical protein
MSSFNEVTSSGINDHIAMAVPILDMDHQAPLRFKHVVDKDSGLIYVYKAPPYLDGSFNNLGWVDG